jgi:putative tryptophan/tyrosine transport system substrate-binding protein
MTRGKGSPDILRRRAVLAVGAAMLAASPLAWAQEAGRTYRISFVSQSPRSTAWNVALFEELRRSGFIEGSNLSITGGFGVALDHADATATVVVKGGPDVILAAGAALTQAVQRATKTIPILAVSDDLVAEQAVASLAHPGGNTTGISILATELDGKRQDVLIDMLLGIRRMAALVDPSTTAPARLQPLMQAAESRDVTLSIHPVRRAEEIAPAIDAARTAGAQALNVLASALFNAYRTRIIEHVAMVRLPAIYQWPEWGEEGGLVAYGPRFTSIYRRLVAPQMVKLLRGARPADIPVEQPSAFELVVNLKTARALGVAVPTAFLIRADQVIE